MIRLSKLLVLVCILMALASCSKERHGEPEDTPSTQDDSVRLYLSAEIALEGGDEDLRSITTKIEQIDGKLIPRPQFVDGQKVEVFTAILSTDRGNTYIAPLEWTYRATDKKLILKQDDGNSITVPRFRESTIGGRFYIAALIAPSGQLKNGSVSFQGVTELRGVEGRSGDDLSHLKIPYWLNWVELKIETGKAKEGSDYKYAKVVDTSGKFKPLGSLIAYKLGNKQRSGAYSFQLSGFTVSSDYFRNNIIIAFDVRQSSKLPRNGAANQIPIRYTFANGHAPTIAHNAMANKIYYAWVYPTETNRRVKTHIVFHGKNSRPETATYRDYTNTYYTDYTMEGKPSGGEVRQGKVHSLTANLTHRLTIPIEYVAEYNLAGGEGFTYTTNPSTPGAQGNLRMADSYDNNQSGYYNWYKVVGMDHSAYNPAPARNLQHQMDNTFDSKYFIPDIDHWWGVFPRASRLFSEVNPEYYHIQRDLVQLGYGSEALYFYSNSTYSTSIVGDDASEAIVYGLRFEEQSATLPETLDTNWDPFEATASRRLYPALLDERYMCAYRYRRVGSKNDWDASQQDTAPTHNSNLKNQIIVDVVYIGYADVAEDGKSLMETISNPDWWDSPTSSRLTKGLHKITRVFPASGQCFSSGNLYYRGGRAYYSSRTRTGVSAWGVRVLPEDMTSYVAVHPLVGISVRPFKKNVDTP